VDRRLFPSGASTAHNRKIGKRYATTRGLPARRFQMRQFQAVDAPSMGA
jgi:hypothetical protein